MPIYDLGYRTWQGNLTPSLLRFTVIAETGIALAWRNRWARRLVLLAWLPALYFAIGFLLLEQGLAHQAEAELASGFLGQFPQAQAVLESLAKGDPLAARHQGWSWLLLTFLRYPQGFVMVLLVGLIAPGLIAKDVQSKAFLLYFSRPLTRSEYIVGKSSVLAGYLFLISAVPALTLYLFAVLLSPPELDVVSSTWDLPFRILAASFVLILPTVTLALAFSSMTKKANYAGFAWFAVWFLGFIAYLMVSNLAEHVPNHHWDLLSLYHTLGKVQNAIFGVQVMTGSESMSVDAIPSAIVLAGITLCSALVLYRRVSSPLRI